MSSELLGSAQNVLKGNLGGAWDITNGYQDAYTDLGIARRFGAASNSMAFSLRDIGAMNGRVVKVRRDVDGQGSDPEEDFSANQVASGALEDWVNGKLESTLPADVATAAAAYSLRKVKASYSGNAVRIRRSSDDIEVDVAFDSDGKVSASSAITNVAEQGGESGQTTDTTLGDFISGTDAFVHTWYDQAGSNDAVQATAANQPKIAESGALLADGLLFDGTNDSFEATDITNVNFPATVVSVSETNDTGSPNKALYSLNNDSNSCTGFYRSTNKYAINNGTTTLAGSATYTTDVHRLKFDLFNGASSAGFSNAVSDISGDIGTQVSQVTHFRIAGSLKTGITNPHNGTIKEIILYTSDQSNNRFKIESNINNYYGLYNDANDLTQSTWQNTGGETFSSTSTDGFSYSNSSSTAFIGVTLSETLALNDSVFVSFNASGITHPSSSDQSPQIRLRDAVDGGSGSSPINQVTNGFNSYTLTYSDGTKANGNHIVFSEGDTAGGTVTISDFKVSRIARNGFVETWYDQSGNGFDLKSQSADTQPFIMNNGGFTGGVHSPTSSSNSTKKYLEVSSPDFDCTDITSSKFGWLAVMANMEENIDGGAGVIFGNTKNTQTYPTGAIGLQLSDTNEGRMFVMNSRTGSAADFIGSVDDTDLFDAETIGTAVVDGSSLSTFLNGSTGSGTFTSLTITSTNNFRIFQSTSSAGGLSYTTASQGFIKELMFMQGDTIDDIATIRNEVNNHYNIF